MSDFLVPPVGRLSISEGCLSSAFGYAVPGGSARTRRSSHGTLLKSTAHLDASDASARLKRGAGILMAIFWAVHLVTMMLRAELHGGPGERGFGDLLESFQRRAAFALFGAFLGYLLYRCLRLLLRRELARQMMIGTSVTLAVACTQTIANMLWFGANREHLAANFLSLLLYWFWFYFSWTAAYLALSYSIAIQAQERHAAELSVKAQEAQVRALRYQINPHFLFNTLNAISALVRDAPQKAEEMLVQLSDFFRRSLSINPMEDVTLSEEVALQRLYLEIERTRFSDRLRFDVSLDAGTAAARVPALLLQPLVENAVKHGVARSEAATCICIRARLDGPVLEIVVENDARTSARASGGEKVGLGNVAERLRSLFGGEASLTTCDLAEGGFRNTLLIPLRR